MGFDENVDIAYQHHHQHHQHQQQQDGVLEPLNENDKFMRLRREEVSKHEQQQFEERQQQLYTHECNNLPPNRQLKVLLVEDDDSTRYIVAALLKNCGYRVVAAPNGLQAWALLEDRKDFDLILTEVLMPGLSGIGLLSRVMHHRSYKSIPVIMMSSHDSTNLVFKCLSKGAADFLVKPVRKNELKVLWQHSWRRCFSSAGSAGGGNESEGGAKKRNSPGDDSDNDDVGALGYSDKGSGTQSSCTVMEKGVFTPAIAGKRSKHQIPTDSETVQKPGRNVANAEDEVRQRADHNEQSEACSAECVDKAPDLIGNICDRQPEANLIKKRAREEGESERHGSNDLEEAAKKPKSTLELTLGTSSERIVLGQSGPSAFTRYASTASTRPCEEIEGEAKRQKENQEFFRGASSVQVPARGFAPAGLPNGVPYATLVSYDNGLPATAYFYAQPPVPPWDHAFSPQNESDMGQRMQQSHVYHHHHVHHHHHNKDDPVEGAGCGSTNNAAGDQQLQNGLSGSGGSSHGYAAGASGASGSQHGSNGANFISNSGSSPSGPDVAAAADTEQTKLSRREAALNKFRQKRKERCFEKKVRYQSRKRLAEQRPRVRGQFVSQAVYDSSKPELQPY